MLKLLIKNEFLKQKGNKNIWIILMIPIIINFLLAGDLMVRYDSWILPQAQTRGISCWQMLINEQKILYFNDLMPVFAAINIISLYEYEYRNNSWRFLLTKPIKRKWILLTKYIVASFNYFIMLLLNLFSLISLGLIFKFQETVPWKYFGLMFAIQLSAGLIIILIHSFLNIRNKNLIVSIGIAGILSVFTSNFYYNNNILKYNPYGFSLFSISQERIEIIVVFISLIIAYFIGKPMIEKYFNNKEIY